MNPDPWDDDEFFQADTVLDDDKKNVEEKTVAEEINDSRPTGPIQPHRYRRGRSGRGKKQAN